MFRTLNDVRHRYLFLPSAISLLFGSCQASSSEGCRWLNSLERRHHCQLKPRASNLCRFPQSGARWVSHTILFLASEGMILTRSLPVRQRSAGFERQTIWGHNETSDSYSVYNVDIHHQYSGRPTPILATTLSRSSGAATHIRKSPSLHRQSPERPFLLK